MSPESGGRPPKASDEEVIATIKQLCDEKNTVAVDKTPIKERLGYSDKGMNNRLSSLVEDDKISRYSASNAEIYWVPESGEQAVDVSVLDFDSYVDPNLIEPSEFSTVKARDIAEQRLPEYTKPNFYGWANAKANFSARYSIYFLALVLLLFVADAAGGVELPEIIVSNFVLLFNLAWVWMLFSGVMILVLSGAKLLVSWEMISENPLESRGLEWEPWEP